MSPRRPGAGRDAAARALAELAAAHGVQRSYVDAFGRRRRAGPGTVLAALRALGVPVERPEDAPAALRAHRRAAWTRPVEPVGVAWAGRLLLPLRVPARATDAVADVLLEPEEGDPRGWRVPLGDLPVTGAAEVDGRAYVRRLLTVPDPLPPGYHRLAMRVGRLRGSALVISAPPRAASGAGRGWGVFLPLYAARTRTTWGVGDFTALASLLAFVGDLGGDLVATLPLLSTFLDEPFDPSPYAPVSRLFWNEIHVDVASSPELARCPEACELVASPGFRREVEMLERRPLVEHRSVIRVKRRVLELLAEELHRGPSTRRDELERFAASRPELDDYARFRAECEHRRSAWPAWPEPARGGRLEGAPEAGRAVRYHRYVQFLAEEQLRRALEVGRERGAALLLDLPLGAHRVGYDTWRRRQLFAAEARAGAPPDRMFARGQDWGFPPLHPERIRDEGYRYVIASVRRQARYAGALRIDHVMSLHRLFWIPGGADATEGLYVRYPAEELYAILVLESHRAGAALVGEDLGTVPPYVRPAMARRGVRRAYVAQAEVWERTDGVLPAVPAEALATVNTHDTGTFAAFWAGRDLDLLEALGAMPPAAAASERERRARLRAGLVRFLRDGGWLAGRGDPDPGRVLVGILRFLGSSPAASVVANLEDLWLEERPQNVPGTVDEYPNWRRRARHPLERIATMPEVVEALRELRRARASVGPGRSGPTPAGRPPARGLSARRPGR